MSKINRINFKNLKYVQNLKNEDVPINVKLKFEIMLPRPKSENKFYNWISVQES